MKYEYANDTKLHLQKLMLPIYIDYRWMYRVVHIDPLYFALHPLGLL